MYCLSACVAGSFHGQGWTSGDASTPGVWGETIRLGVGVDVAVLGWIIDGPFQPSDYGTYGTLTVLYCTVL